MKRTTLLLVVTLCALAIGIILSIVYNTLFLFLFIPFGFGWGFASKSRKNEQTEEEERDIAQEGNGFIA